MWRLTSARSSPYVLWRRSAGSGGCFVVSPSGSCASSCAIEHLGVAADALGKGRDVPYFAFSAAPRGAHARTAFPDHGPSACAVDPANALERWRASAMILRTPPPRNEAVAGALADAPETTDWPTTWSTWSARSKATCFAPAARRQDPANSVDLAESWRNVAAGARRDKRQCRVGCGGQDVELRADRHQRC